MIRRCVLWASLLAATGCNRHVLPTAEIAVGPQSMWVELAYEPQSRAQGLMYRNAIRRGEGMLFIYPKAEPRSFWMKNTRIPLSIAFADAQGTIVRIADMKPLSTKRTSSQKPAKYALEVNQGWFRTHDIDVGDRISKIPDLEIR